MPEYASKFLETDGIATDGCAPFVDAAFADDDAYPDRACATVCADGSALTRYKAATGSTFLLNAAVSAAQQYLAADGPITAAFTVYEVID